MAATLLFFYTYFDWPSMPRFQLEILLNSEDAIETSRADWHNYGGMIKLSQFWNMVYKSQHNYFFGFNHFNLPRKGLLNVPRLAALQAAGSLGN